MLSDLDAVLFDLDGTLLDPVTGACPTRTRALLRHLRERFHVALVTNGRILTQRDKLRDARLEALFDAVWIAQAVGAAKPHAAPFLKALAAAGCPAGRALFVGDDPVADIGGAARVGMRTCWVSRGRAFPPDARPAPDAVIVKVCELAASGENACARLAGGTPRPARQSLGRNASAFRPRPGALDTTSRSPIHHADSRRPLLGSLVES